jgi:hypothetical protein
MINDLKIIAILLFLITIVPDLKHQEIRNFNFLE